MLQGPRKWFSEKSNVMSSYTIHDDQFHWKYILTFSMILILAFLGTTMPVLFFINRNYQIFEKIAYDTYPSLIENLLQEKNWLWILFTINLVSLAIFSIYFSVKFIKKILTPVHQVEFHLHQMMSGKWDTPINFDDSKGDLKSIKINYDYFHRFLKVNTETELNLLKRIVVDPNNRDSYIAWQNLIEAKSQRIGLNADEIMNNRNYSSENKINIDFSKKKKLKKIS